MLVDGCRNEGGNKKQRSLGIENVKKAFRNLIQGSLIDDKRQEKRVLKNKSTGKMEKEREEVEVERGGKVGDQRLGRGQVYR